MSDWNRYTRKGFSELRPYVPGEDVSQVSISTPDQKAGSPKVGDMIARNPDNHDDKWLVAEQYFKKHLVRTTGSDTPVGLTEQEKDVMLRLVEFWNAFIVLPDSNGNDSTVEVCNAIHVIQGVMARRVAKRLDPDLWL